MFKAMGGEVSMVRGVSDVQGDRRGGERRQRCSRFWKGVRGVSHVQGGGREVRSFSHVQGYARSE